MGSQKKNLQKAAANFRRLNPVQSAVRGLISAMARIIKNSGASEIVIHANSKGLIYGANTKEGQELRLA